jgi:hypothetical protein
MTIEMLVARIETLETQIGSLFKEQGAKDNKAKKSSIEVLEDPEVVVAKKKTKKESKNSDSEVLGETEVVAIKKVKKVKNDTSSDDEGKPKKKKGTNGYILFSNANRDDVKAKLFVGDEKPKNTEIMKQLAELWQSTSAEEKEVWNAKAKETNDAKEAGDVN